MTDTAHHGSTYMKNLIVKLIESESIIGATRLCKEAEDQNLLINSHKVSISKDK
jgi:hypothetical protein